MSLLALSAPVLSFTSYANEFVDPDLILAKAFPNTTVEAQKTILEWAEELAAEGPWCTSHVFFLRCDIGVSNRLQSCDEQDVHGAFGEQARLHELGTLVRSVQVVSGSFFIQY